MLVLMRKQEEQIVIGEDIVVTVLEIRGDKVRIGIEAPKKIPVHRSEVHQTIHLLKTEGTQAPGGTNPLSPQ